MDIEYNQYQHNSYNDDVDSTSNNNNNIINNKRCRSSPTSPLYNHHKRLRHIDNNNDTDIYNSNSNNSNVTTQHSHNNTIHSINHIYGYNQRHTLNITPHHTTTVFQELQRINQKVHNTNGNNNNITSTHVHNHSSRVNLTYNNNNVNSNIDNSNSVSSDNNNNDNNNNNDMTVEQHVSPYLHVIQPHRTTIPSIKSALYNHTTSPQQHNRRLISPLANQRSLPHSPSDTTRQSPTSLRRLIISNRHHNNNKQNDIHNTVRQLNIQLQQTIQL